MINLVKSIRREGFVKFNINKHKLTNHNSQLSQSICREIKLDQNNRFGGCYNYNFTTKGKQLFKATKVYQKISTKVIYIV